MSGRNLFVLSGFPRAVLANGLGRYVCQLQRITIKFCKSHGSSRGVREFLENDLIDFAKTHPNIVVYVKPRRHRCPVFVAEYLNGERKWMSAHNYTRDEVNKWLNLFKTQSGIPEVRLRKTWHTDNPSIQGPWSPFYFRNPQLNITKFPNHELSFPKNLPPSATDILLDMFKRQKLMEDENEKSSTLNFEETDKEVKGSIYSGKNVI